jgi:hypothetical protein
MIMSTNRNDIEYHEEGPLDERSWSEIMEESIREER